MPAELFDSGVPRSESDLVASYFTEAAGRLSQIVTNPFGNTESSREFRQARAATLIGQINPILRSLKSKAFAWTNSNMRKVWLDGIKTANRQAAEVGVRPKGQVVQGSFNLIDRRTVEIFARDTYADFAKAADSMGQRTEHVLRQTAAIGLTNEKINRLLAGGVIEGTPVETGRLLREQLRAIHGDQVRIENKNGDWMEFEVGYYADLVARTKTREATVTARHERLESLGLDLVSIVGRISNNFCTAFLGQVFSLSGKSDKYPALAELPDGGPPFHPNCSKNTRPFVEELATEKQLDHAEMLEPSMLGMNQAEAQKAFKDLQVKQQVEERYRAATKAGEPVVVDLKGSHG